MKNKKLIIILGVIAVIIASVFIVKSNSAPEPTTKTKIPEAVNTVPVSDRPYVTLAPTSGKHPAGTQVEITVHSTTLASTAAEYELEYQAGSLLQGVFGSIDFSQDTPPTSRTLLLGTCSAGGKCDYNQDVSGGTLLLRLTGGEQKFAVKGEWSYQLMGDREGKFSSRDSKFRVDIGEKGLPASSYAIIMQPMGLPEAIDGEIIGGPYHVSAGSKPTFKTAELTLRLSESVESATLLGWTGSTWKEYPSDIEDKTLTATIDSLTTFVVIKSLADN